MSPFLSLEGNFRETWTWVLLWVGAFAAFFLTKLIAEILYRCPVILGHLPLEAGGAGTAQRGWICVSPAGSCSRRCHHGAGRAHPARTRVAAGIHRHQLTGSPCCLPPSKTHSWFRQSSPFVSCNSVFLSTKIKSALTESLQLRNILDGF